jgi:hypothetical protein
MNTPGTRREFLRTASALVTVPAAFAQAPAGKVATLCGFGHRWNGLERRPCPCRKTQQPL